MSTVGFVVIVILYATVGLLAAAGTIVVGRKVFRAKAEQAFYGLFLVIIAAFYLAFAAYFGAAQAWRLEIGAVLVFAAMGIVGARVPFALIVGYPLHGLWDLLHELQAHGAYSAFEPGELTPIPLAYGVFCAAFDLLVGAYCYTRRADWSAAWSGTASST